MDELDNLFPDGMHFADESEVKELSNKELQMLIAISAITLKSFSELSDKDLKTAMSLIPKLSEIMKATMHNVKLMTKEVTLRSLPMN